MSEEQEILAQLIARCWRDDSFKKRFMTDPKGVLAENGMEVEAGANIKVVEDTESLTHIVLPPAPPKGELSDDELAAVAGGSNAAQAPPTGPARVRLPARLLATVTTTAAPH